MTVAALAVRIDAPMDHEICWAAPADPVMDLAGMTDDDVLAEVFAESTSYLLALRAAITALRDETLAHARTQRQHLHLLEQFRKLRAVAT